MKYIFLFIFLYSVSLASLTKPPYVQYFTGYRNDRLHWHLQSPGDSGKLLYSEVYKNIQFWENLLALTLYKRDIYLFLRGGYGAFGVGGEGTQRYANLKYVNNQPHFYFTPGGWAIDGTAHLGYCVNLTEGRTYKVVLIPFFGYSGHYESLKRCCPEPSKIESSSYAISSKLPSSLELTWYGFLLGGMLHIDPGEKVLFDIGYNYNWLHLCFHTRYQTDLWLGPVLFTEETTYCNSVKAKTGSNLGHTGWIKALYRIDSSWQAGLAAQINYFVSGNVHATHYQSMLNQAPIKNPEKLKIRWTALSGWVTLSKGF